MKLSEYPQPQGSTGLGIHLSASNSHPMGEYADGYPGIIKELAEMGFRWAKLVVGGTNGLDACRALLAAGIMPIVRFYEGEQAPDSLVSRQPELGRYVREYVAVGVRYFEVSNEPNLFNEWKGGYGPEWQMGAIPDRVAEAWVRDAQVVLDAGGLPGTPALSPGGHYNDVDFLRTFCLWLKQRGHADLLQRGCWVAIHNGTLDHPLDYPDDPVNQDGIPVSQAEYDAHIWAKSRDEVNAERAANQNPGQTVHSVDANGRHTGGSNCWRKYEAYERIVEETFGFQLPILATEGGVWVGEWVNDQNGVRIFDPRYPAVSVEMQKDWTVQICRDMMSGATPGYYFCTGFWLMANRGMGNPHDSFERDAWYSHLWEYSHLPVVEALKALPKQTRPAPEDTAPPEPEPGISTDAEVADVLWTAGFAGLGLTIGVAIVIAESQCNPRAVGDVDVPGPGDSSNGWWQINTAGHPECYPGGRQDKSIVFDPVLATREAYRISSGGQFWTQWATYTTGVYHEPEVWNRALAVTSQLPTTEQLRDAAYWRCMKVPYTPGNALMKAAMVEGPCVPLCVETPFNVGCGLYVGQVFLGVVAGVSRVYMMYCRDRAWDQVNRFDM